MTDAKMLVFTNAVEGRDEEFNKWYDTEHRDDVLAIPGIEDCVRYEIAPVPGRGEPTHRYLAIYELSEDPDVVLRGFQERAASGKLPLSPTLDLTSMAMQVWRAR
ncbi:DUF4286 family protein [Nocardia higoensis]|uniref:DUF4286 family protein n=1 Tax=Nocardia higoensis TaxID=228599 RepID=UPI000315ACBA|nr:DUF4286 family protein [Nocardia higoensis]